MEVKSRATGTEKARARYSPDSMEEMTSDDPVPSRAGATLARMTVVPALLMVSCLAVALPLLMAGIFRPLPMLVLYVPVAGVVLYAGLRRSGDAADRCPWWVVA